MQIVQAIMICNLEFLFSNTQTKCKRKNLQLVPDSKSIESVKIKYTKEKMKMLKIRYDVNLKYKRNQRKRKGRNRWSVLYNFYQQFRWIINIAIYKQRFQLIVYNYFNMKSIILVLVLAYLVISVIIVRSQVGDLITLPGPPHGATQNTFLYNVDLSGSGAVWIWDTNWNNPSTPSPIVVTDDFYASCTSEMTLNATADDIFTATLNTNDILNGNDWRKIYTAKFIPKCGRNNFSITAYNRKDIPPSKDNPAGLVYWISQDTSSCYSCPKGQNWNPATCSCQCSDHCACRRNQVWSGLPSCQCTCATSTSNNSNKCSQNQYWDQNSCSCKCLPKVCIQKYLQNPFTCQCQCVRESCLRIFPSNFTLCSCNKQDSNPK